MIFASTEWPGRRVAWPKKLPASNVLTVYGDAHVVGRYLLDLIPYRHYGIELPDGTVCENSPPGVRIVGYADFGRGRPTQVTNPGTSLVERDLAVQRALSRVGERRCRLSGNNCEHFASWCATGVAISRQAITWIGSFIRIAFAVAATIFAIALVQAAPAE